MSIIKSNGAGESGGDFYDFLITNSLLFNGSGGLRINSAEENTAYWTLSVWVKRHKLGGNYSTIMSATDYASTYSNDLIGFGSANTLFSIRGSNANSFTSNSGNTVVRDCGQWYHYHLRNNNGTVTRTLNGVVDSTYDISGTGTRIGRSGNHDIGAYGGSSESYNNNFSLAEFYFINDSGFNNDNNYNYDQFAEFKNGVLIPKENSLNAAAIGDGGWYYEFKQTGDNADASGVGADSSGNAHHATIIGTVAAHCRARPDTPTNNFCTLNFNRTGETSNLSNGALTYKDSATGGPRASVGTFGATSGKWYFEVRLDNDLYSTMSGFMDVSQYTGDHNATDTAKGTGYLGWDERGYLYPDQTSTVLSGHSYTTNDVVSFAIDVDAGKAFIRKNADAFLASADPSTGDNPNHTFTPGQPMTPFIASYRSAEYTLNCGQDSTFGGQETATTNTDSNGQGAFHTEPPTGYLALCAANLPEPNIGANKATQSNDLFQTVIYDGNGSTQDIAVNFKPDWTWIKNRDATDEHQLFDSSRGVTKVLESSTTAAEDANDDTLTAFTSTGFSLGDDVTVNTNNEEYVSWNWKANGGTTSSNSDGSVTTTVQANTTAGFSIVLYTGTGANATFGHGLGAVPKWMIFKTRSNTGNWMVYHGANTAAPETDFLKLDTDVATEDLNTVFNDTAPTSSVFSLGSNGDVNTSGRTQVAYCFAEVEGYSKFGVYTGNNTAANGPMVFTGFKPAYLMVKNTASGSWTIYDNKRKAYNPRSIRIAANLNNTETDTSTQAVDFYAGGFKILSNNSDQNASSATYIYMAFAKEPFKYSNGG